jgi:hypothetical protein
LALAGAALLAACSSASPAATPTTVRGPKPVGGIEGTPGYLVYWDQNEEVDMLSMPSGTQAQLMPAWDLNGQVCVLPDGSGRFVGGLDPTVPNQHNPGGLKPYKQPAIGEELNLANGAFSGQVLYVPGPFKMPGQSIGEDSPATNGEFNGNSTYTGCAFDRRGDLLATDIGTAQGAFPVPDDGRLVEWFAPSYTTYCILYGPVAEGVGPHHVDGILGLSQPGMLATTDNGDLLLPEAGIDEVMRVDHTSFPESAASCPGGLYPRGSLKMSVFFKGSGALLPFPSGVARDPTCDCYAISSFFGNPAIAWFDNEGRPEPGRTPVPGTPLSQLGQNPQAYNPFGLAFAPDGTLYFVDIHITCKGGNTLIGCGTADYGGRVMRVTFTDAKPSPAQVVAGGFDFPTSVTVCVPAHMVCPYPTGRPLVAPASGPSENDAPARGPASVAPAKAGFGT